MAPLKKALEHEMLVTASSNAIYAAAYEVRDFRTRQMLDWFIKEQGEEEKTAADLITKMDPVSYTHLYPGFESEPESMEWVSQYADANMVKTDFFEARSTAYAKSTALIDDL